MLEDIEIMAQRCYEKRQQPVTLIKKEAPVKFFFCGIFKKNFSAEHLLATASEDMSLYRKFVSKVDILLTNLFIPSFIQIKR